MSRIGNLPITVPAGVEVKVDGNHVTVKGPKGTLEREVHKNIKVTVDGNTVKVERPNDEPLNKSLHGLTRTLINNMIKGTSEEFTRKLEVNGVGYRAQKQGKKLVLTLGYSHPVEMVEPEGITFDGTTQEKITINDIVYISDDWQPVSSDATVGGVIVRGIDKEKVGQMAAVIRTKRPPEVYRGKGIKYAEEVIRRKEGKAGKK